MLKERYEGIEKRGRLTHVDKHSGLLRGRSRKWFPLGSAKVSEQSRIVIDNMGVLLKETFL
jgi:hypothetical protein